MAEVDRKAADHGARWAITFVDAHNEPSLKGCLRAGFAPYVTRREKFRFFSRRIVFERLALASHSSA